MDDLGFTVGVTLGTALPFLLLSCILLPNLGAMLFAVWVGLSAAFIYSLTGSEFAALFIGALGLAAVQIRRHDDRRRIDKAKALISKHARELAIHRIQLMQPGAYGVIDKAGWDREVARFAASVLQPEIGRVDRLGPIWATIHTEIEAAAASIQPASNFHPAMAPLEYEAMCADLLRHHGWDARTTSGSGDQGVDVLATQGPHRVVLQCKLYGKPVGNAAVQEAIAGQRFEQATHAAVVSNATYTRAARQLAGVAGVMLLHHDELPDLLSLVEGGAQSLQPARIA